MSMDWRPVDLYVYDMKLKKSDGHGFRDMKITWHGNDGSKKEFIDSDAKQGYPELAFLLDGFGRIYKEYANDAKARELFGGFENALKQVENEFDERMVYVVENRRMYSLDDDEFFRQPMHDVIEQWFYGLLDSSFYYNSINNETLCNYIFHALNHAKAD